MSRVLLPGTLAASRRRAGGGTPSVLGNNVKGASSAFGAAGSSRVVKHTLAAPATLTELHGWFTGGAGEQWILVIYADNGSGAPGARVAYTSPLTAVSGDIELSQAGFSVPLAAGDYYLGFTLSTGSSQKYFYGSGTAGQDKISSTATFNPPNNPFGTVATSDSRLLSIWAVVLV